MEKKYLFSPGPTMLPPEVLLKMAEPIMHHREPEFEKIFAEIREGLKYLFQRGFYKFRKPPEGNPVGDRSQQESSSSGDP